MKANLPLLTTWKHRRQPEAKQARRQYLAQLEWIEAQLGPRLLLFLLRSYGLLGHTLPLPERVQALLQASNRP
jgi:hypothetical protein